MKIFLERQRKSIVHMRIFQSSLLFVFSSFFYRNSVRIQLEYSAVVIRVFSSKPLQSRFFCNMVFSTCPFFAEVLKNF